TGTRTQSAMARTGTFMVASPGCLAREWTRRLRPSSPGPGRGGGPRGAAGPSALRGFRLALAQPAPAFGGPAHVEQRILLLEQILVGHVRTEHQILVVEHRRAGEAPVARQDD